MKSKIVTVYNELCYGPDCAINLGHKRRIPDVEGANKKKTIEKKEKKEE